MRKANTSLVMLTLIGLFIFFFIVLPTFLPTMLGGSAKNNVVGKAQLQGTIYNMNYAMDSANTYMQTALSYSYYQACYDTLKNGIDAKNGYWYDSSDSAIKEPDYDQFMAALKKSILANLNIYRSKPYQFMGDYQVSIPQYNDGYVGTEMTGTTLDVVMISSGNMEISKNQEGIGWAKIEKTAMVYGSYGTECYDVYQKGIDTGSTTKAKVKEIVDSAADKLSTQFGSRVPSQSQIEQAKASLLKDLESGIEKSGSDISGSTQVVDLPWIGQTTTPLGYISVDRKIKDKSVEIQTVESTPGYIKLRCTVSATVETTVTGFGKYPVYNGKDISSENLKLTFLQKVSQTKETAIQDAPQII